MSSLQDRVATLMTQNLKIPEERITADVPFADLDLDSLMLLEFAVVLEKEFDIQIDDEEISADQTIVDMTALLAGKGAA